MKKQTEFNVGVRDFDPAKDLPKPKMKKLLFIDNDNERTMKEQLHYTEDFLIVGCCLDASYVKSMKTIPDFWRMSRDEMSKLVYDGDEAIVTWSVYTPTGNYSSKSQLEHLLSGAGRYGIKNKIYIDASGEIKKALDRLIQADEKMIWSVMNAIESNFIITYDKWKPVRLVIDIKGFYESPFKLMPIDLNTLLA